MHDHLNSAQLITANNNKMYLYPQVVCPLKVPGEVHGQYEAWKRYGWLPWKHLVQPAIDLARNEFEITACLADVLTKEMEKDISNDPALRLVRVM